MDQIALFLATLGPQHWLVFGLALLIAEMATGTTYLLWPAVAAFLTALVSWMAPTSWSAEFAVFAALVVALTAFGRPLLQRWREQGGASTLNERSASLIGERGQITAFENGVGSVKLNDTIWRAASSEQLAPGENVEIVAVDGVTLKVKRLG